MHLTCRNSGLLTCTIVVMGIDCADVRQVIYLGPPEDREAYIQETGHAGRDGKYSIAILIILKGGRHRMELGMRQYVNSDTCRRHALFSDFEGYEAYKERLCLCCDICKKLCKCDECPSVYFLDVKLYFVNGFSM